MNGDDLERAVVALRARYDGRSETASETEAAILGRLRRKTRQRQRSRLTFLIAALLAASSAWAARDTLSESMRRVGSWLMHEPRTTSSVPRPQSHQVTDRPAEASPSSAANDPQPTPHGPAAQEPAAPPAASSAPPVARAHSKSKAPTLTSSADTPLRPKLPEPVPSGNPMALYQEAHRLHFVEQHPQRALAAWDRYLAGGGHDFALEARYNRALCLLRLGRTADAHLELRPFARGDYGGYRQAEAAALIQAQPTTPQRLRH